MIDDQNSKKNTAHEFDSDMPNLVNVELMIKCVNNLKLGKACELNDL